MNTLTEHRQPPPPTIAPATRPATETRKVTTLDRIALRIGLALIVWSRRHARHISDREQHSQKADHHQAREAREHEARRQAHLTFPVR
jgi:hypothetical protein